MRVGLLAACTRTGLGYQTRALYRNLRPTKTLVADLSKLKRVSPHREWYQGSGAVFTDGFPSNTDCNSFVRDLDVLIACETPLNYRLFAAARAAGVGTILQYNWEFLDYYSKPALPAPTVLAAPTTWGIDDVRAHDWAPVRRLPVPIPDTGALPRHITEIKTVGHVAGLRATRDRNGTGQFLAVARRLQHLNVTWVVHCQRSDPTLQRECTEAGVELSGEVQDRRGMYDRMDLHVLPRRFGGLCLPTLESLASGIPVIMPDISPNRDLLPPQWLVPATATDRFRVQPEFDAYTADVSALAATVEEAVTSRTLATQWSDTARDIAATITWSALRPTYDDFLAATARIKAGGSC